MSKSNGKGLLAADEQDVIGCILHEPHRLSEVAAIISLADLTSDQARIAFAAAQRVLSDGRPFANYQEIIEEIEHDGGLSRCPLQWLQDAANRVPDPSMAAYYASRVRKLADDRRLIDAARTLAEKPCDNSVELVRHAWQSRFVPAPVAPPSRFRFHTAADFDALELKRDYFIPSILAAGPVPCILAGSFKTLKTSIVIDLFLSLASGTRFLNHFNVLRPVRCAIMSGESGGHALQNLCRRVAISKGITLASLEDNFRISTAVPLFDQAEHMAELERFIVEHKIEVIGIDPTYLAMAGMSGNDASNIFTMGARLTPLALLAQRTGCLPLIVHHNSKGATRLGNFQPAELSDIAWGGFPEWAAQWLLLARRANYDPDSNGEHALWLTAGGRDGHSSLVGVNVTEGTQNDPEGRRWEVEIVEAAKVRREGVTAAQEKREQANELKRRKSVDTAREKIIAHLHIKSDGETKTELKARTGKGEPALSAALDELLSEGVIVHCELVKGRGKVCDGYKIRGQSSGEGWLGAD